VGTAPSCCSEHGLQCFAIGNHLVGQAVCDPIDERHGRSSAHVWGDGDPRACAGAPRREYARHRARGRRASGVKTVTGFSPARRFWHAVLRSPPTSQEYIERGFADFATRWTTVSTPSEAEGVELRARGHPDRDRVRHRVGRIARWRRSTATTRLRLQLRPEPPRVPGRRLRGVFVRRFGARIFNAAHEGLWVEPRRRHGRACSAATPRSATRAATGTSAASARGMIDFESIIVALNDVGYAGPLSVGMGGQPHGPRARRDRERGVLPPARLSPAAGAFDAVFDKSRQAGGGMAG
jgi:hypothetical protein